MSFIAELKRRNVIRVGILYAVASWLILQVADVLFGLMGLPDWSLRLVLALLLLGFPIALIFAWVYELTPEGLRKESEIAPADSITAHTANKLNVAVILLLVAAMGMFAADWFFERRAQGPETTDASAELSTPEIHAAAVPAPQSPPEQHSLALGVAVLPFSNLSTEQENAFFASGVHEDVLTYLSRVADLRVISRTSVENYVEGALSGPEIGRALGVSHVVEGSVRRAGNRVRVTVQLIDAETDAQVWSESYDRTLDDIFAIQTEIAQAVVTQLEAKLTPEEAASLATVERTDIEAYDLVIQGRQVFTEARRTWDVPTYVRSAELFRRAVREDPDYLPAWRGLVLACGAVVWFGVGQETVECRADVEEAISRMRAVDAESIDTRTAVGIYRYRVSRDLAGAVDILAPVVAERPNDTDALLYLALAARRLGLWEMALDAMRRVAVLDPASSSVHRNLIELLWNSTDYQAAIEAAEAAIERFPGDLGFRLDRAGLVYLHTGDLSAFRELVPALPPEQRLSSPYPPFAEGVFDGQAEAIRWLAESRASGLERLDKQILEALAVYAWGGEPSTIIDQNSMAAAEEFAADASDAPYIQAKLGTLMALGGHPADALGYRAQALKVVEESRDILVRNAVRSLCAGILALAGDPAGGWREMEPLIRQPNGPTEWQLYFDLFNQRVYGSVPGYEALRGRLEAELEARQ